MKILLRLCLCLLLLLGSSCSSAQKSEALTLSQQDLFITLSAGKDDRIFYTTDGSLPDQDSLLYTEPFPIIRNDRLALSDAEINVGSHHVYAGDVPAATVVRAIAVSPQGEVSEVLTRTCFAKQPELLTVSLIMDYTDLLDPQTGILVKGQIYDDWAKTPEGQEILASGEDWKCQGNYTQKGKDWERPVLLEIIDGDDTLLQPAGIRIKGDASRVFPQRSFNIYFRERYGSDRLNYELLPGIASFRSFSLRNGGNDAVFLKFKDAWLQELLSPLNFTVQASRPALVYINGEYWGIYDLQEKYSAASLKEHYGVEDVLIVKEGELDEGEDESAYNELLSFAGKDLSDPVVWQQFQETVDTVSMADYFAAEIYIGNADWKLDRNFSLWRTVERGDGYSDGRWRFLLYDTEFSSSLYGKAETAASFDHYRRALQEFPFFAAAMRNEEFRELFRESLYRVRNLFSEEAVNTSLDRYLSERGPYMPDFYRKFGNYSANYDSTPIRDFFRERQEMAWYSGEQGR